MLNINDLKTEILKTDFFLLDDMRFKSYLNNMIINYLNENDLKIDIEYVKKLTKDLFYEFRGLGVINHLLDDDEINEIMINAHDKIFIEKNGQIYRSEYKFESENEYNRIIQKIVGDAGREVNVSNPIVDIMLNDGSRVNIILPPISLKSPSITIRKFSKENLTMEKLIEFKTITLEVAEFLKKIIKSKYNIIIGGGTSSGKTTFLNALSEYIDDAERIVTIEDSRELRLINKENIISLESRMPNSSNKGKISIKQLIVNSLRMRPDRIIVGEVRADETLDMLQAMNTGHDGALSTAHANSTVDMISRLETMVLRSSEEIPLEAVKRMINSSIEIIIQLKRINGNKRRVVEISELLSDEGKTIINILYKYDYKKDELIKVGEMKNTEKLERIYYEKK